MEWWEIPIIFVAFVLGSMLGTLISNWIKVKLGWMDRPKKGEWFKRG